MVGSSGSGFGGVNPPTDLLVSDSEGGDLLLTARVVGLGSGLVRSSRVWWVGKVSGWFEHP